MLALAWIRHTGPAPPSLFQPSKKADASLRLTRRACLPSPPFQSYSAYLALLYAAVALLVMNIGLCVWVAWCFKEQKFPVVWPIKVGLGGG